MQINSASIDHTKLLPGLHLAETLTIGGQTVYSYDLRFLRPVKDATLQSTLSPGIIHAVEHYLAHYLRQTDHPESIISFFPYGCATGFGCLSTLEPRQFVTLLTQTITNIYLENPPVPFADPARCGNAFMFDVFGAQDAMHNFASWVLHQTMDEILNVPRL